MSSVVICENKINVDNIIKAISHSNRSWRDAHDVNCAIYRSIATASHSDYFKTAVMSIYMKR